MLYEGREKCRGVASPSTRRPRPKNFSFDHYTSCNQFMRRWGELKSLRSQSVGNVRLVVRAIFSVCGNESQPGLQKSRKARNAPCMNVYLGRIVQWLFVELKGDSIITVQYSVLGNPPIPPSISPLCCDASHRCVTTKINLKPGIWVIFTRAPSTRFLAGI